MKIAVQSSALGLHSELFLENEDVNVHHIASEDMLDILHSSMCRGGNHEDSEDQDLPESYECIILNTDDVEELHHILEFIMSSVDSLVRRPRIILLSKLLSWGGRKYKVPIGCSISEFNARNPYLTEDALYKVENMFQTCATLTKLDMCIVGVGLVYGSEGYDFKDLCKRLFLAEEGSEQVVFSTCEGVNTVPMIHHTDLLGILEYLSITPEAFPAFFIPAVDFSTESLQSILASLSKTSGRTVRCTTEAEAMEAVMSSNCQNTHHQWDLDLSFAESHRLGGVALQYPNGMVDCSSQVWREFLAKSCSPPCSILVAGPPCSLKTTFSHDLADTLGLKYINWVTSVKKCLENFVEKPSPSSDPSTEEKKEINEPTGGESLGGTIDLSKIDDAYVALRLEIERAIKVSKKMKDDAVFDLNDVVYDKLLLSVLPNNLVSEAIAAQLQMDELCQKRGYVLDVWGPEEKLLVSKHQLYELTNTKPPKPIVPLQDAQQDGGVGGEVEGGGDDLSLDSYQFKETSTEEMKPQLIVELQCGVDTSIRQFLTPLGIVQAEGVKMSKDQLALIKEIEGRVADYKALLKPIPIKIEEGASAGGDTETTTTAENETEIQSETKTGKKTDKKSDKKSKNKDNNVEVVIPYTQLSHPLVQQCCEEGYTVVRVDVNNIPPPLTTTSEEIDEKEKGKTPRTARTEEEKEKEKDKEEMDGGEGLQVEVSPDPPEAPTSATIRDIYTQYAAVYGPLDWVSLPVPDMFHTPGLGGGDGLGLGGVPNTMINAEAVKLDSPEGGGGGDVFDLELSALHDQQHQQQEEEEESRGASAPTNRIEELNTTLQALGGEICGILQPSAGKLNNYLVENVLQHLAEALVIIHRERIEDPVFFLSDFLRKRGEELEVSETKRAYEKYVAAVQEAERLEQEAASQLLSAVESSTDEWD